MRTGQVPVADLISREARRRKSLLAFAGFSTAMAVSIYAVSAIEHFTWTILLLVDPTLVIICAFVLWRRGEMSAFHPALVYLFFHVYTYTFRLFAVSTGTSLLPSLPGLSLAEVYRAVWSADLALVAMTVAWLLVARRERTRYGPLPAQHGQLESNLRPVFIWGVAPVAFIIGILGLRSFGYAVSQTELRLGEWQTSNYLTTTVTWAAWAIIMLVYQYGPRWWLMVLIVPVLSLLALNTARFAIVVTSLLLCFIYLSRQQKKWFPMWMLGLLFLVAAVWFPLKEIRVLIQTGEDASGVIEGALSYSRTALDTSTGDTAFLDQAASIMTLVDDYGRFFYGEAWFPVLVSPIPRQLWPEKPRMNEYLWRITTRERPMAEMGMVPTLVGDAYVNFGYPGVVLVPFLVAYLYGWGYFKAFRKSHYSIQRFLYLLAAANLIQVYRDGVPSIITFTVISSAPMMAVVYLHWLAPLFRQANRKRSARSHANSKIKPAHSLEQV